MILVLGSIGVHQAIYWVLPSIEIINNSGVQIKQASAELPKSNLDFGLIENGQHNRVYYSLDQNDGTILYEFSFSNGNVVNGSCMYIYDNMVNDRIVIHVNQDEVVCEYDT